MSANAPKEEKSAPVVMLGKCPICSKRATHEFRPFCSKRCADVDLSRWFTGQYAVPSVEEPDPDEVDPENPDFLPERS